MDRIDTIDFIEDQPGCQQCQPRRSCHACQSGRFCQSGQSGQPGPKSSSAQFCLGLNFAKIGNSNTFGVAFANLKKNRGSNQRVSNYRLW